MSLRGALDVAYTLQARAADQVDQLNLLVLAVNGGDVSKYEAARDQLDRRLGAGSGDVVEIAEYATLADLASAKGWAV